MALLLVLSSRLYDRYAWQKRNSWRPISLIMTSLDDQYRFQASEGEVTSLPCFFCFCFFVCNSFLLVYLASKSMFYFKRDGRVSLSCLHLIMPSSQFPVMPLETVLTLRKLCRFSCEGEKYHFRQFRTRRK